jgi:hypothetical protein
MRADLHDHDRPDTDPFSRCLAYLVADQIAKAERQARRIEDAASRRVAQDQIRFVLEIKAYLAEGDEERARRLTRSLIGGIRQKYETALGIRPDRRARPRSARRSRPDLTSFPPDIRDSIEQLTRILERARAGKRATDFSPAVLLHLGWIAHRAWRRWSVGQRISPLRASASEIRITAACLRRRIEEGGGRLTAEDLSRETGLSRMYVMAVAKNLRLFLLRGSGWRMVGDAKTGFELVPEDPDILPAS